MKSQRLVCVVALTLFAALPAALASTTWYVNGVSGSDSNNCQTPTTACKTIGHAIALASSGDSIMVGAATYTENLTLGISLTIVGSGAVKTIVDGGGNSTVITISNSGAVVALSKFTIRNGSSPSGAGGGINNSANLVVNRSTLSGNNAQWGGGISNGGTLTISNSTLTGNAAKGRSFSPAKGGGIYNVGQLTINKSTLNENTAFSGVGGGAGGGIWNGGAAMLITNSTIAGNSTAGAGGGIYNAGNLKISSSTVSGNSGGLPSGIYSPVGSATLQNSIVANNSGGNCGGTMTSHGYNLSSDGTCNFNNTGDLNNTDPMLGPLQNNGGPTQTVALPSGSPAVDAGNPNGCTDGQGHLLKTDQRGKPRPDTEDTGGCDMGAYERQSD
jgi:hypothetical protein